MREGATELFSEKMTAGIDAYREALSETPAELKVYDHPTVNVTQGGGSWVELRLCYLTHSRRGQRVRKDMSERVLERFNEHPDRVAFPMSRNR